MISFARALRKTTRRAANLWRSVGAGSMFAPMMYRAEADRTLAISQPAHAWISGQLMRRLDVPLSEPLLLAGEQHDIGWLDWERAPSFDAATRRPPSFREVGAVVHAPMWTAGVERALSAWGPHVALLISRHGGRIYRRFGLPVAGSGRRRSDPGLSRRTGAARGGMGGGGRPRRRRAGAPIRADRIRRCAVAGGMRRLAAAGRFGFPATRRASASPRRRRGISGWIPGRFATRRSRSKGRGGRLPSDGFADEAAMRAWLTSASREAFSARLAPA